MEISTPRGRSGGAAPPSANLGPPRISETIRARRLKFKLFNSHLDRTKCSFWAWKFSARVRRGGQAAYREASSCNAPQLPRFLVSICFVAVCTGTNFELRRTGHAGNWSLQRYIRLYENCVYVDGNLEITYLENDSYDLSFLSSIQEVQYVQTSVWHPVCCLYYGTVRGYAVCKRF